MKQPKNKNYTNQPKKKNLGIAIKIKQKNYYKIKIVSIKKMFDYISHKGLNYFSDDTILEKFILIIY